MKSSGWIIMLSVVAIFAPAPAGWAASGDDCEASGTIESCLGELLTTQGDLIDAAAGMLGDAQTMNLFSFGRKRFGLVDTGPKVQSDLEARIDSLINEHGRAEAAHKTNTDTDYNEMIAQADKVKGEKCTLSDIIFFDSLKGNPPPGLRPVTDKKFGDGNCNVFHAVDENGFDVTVNERKENMCERVCVEKEVGGVNQKGKSKDRLVARLQEGISASTKAKESIAAQAVRMLELRFVLSSLELSEGDFQLAAAGGGGPCDSGYGIPGDLIAAEVINVIIVGLDVAVIAGKIITEILDTAKDIAEDACKQDVAGFNGSSGCIPLTVAFHISQGITDVLDGIKSGLASTRDIILLAGEIARSFQTDTLQTCTQGIKQDTDTLMGQVTGLEGAAIVTHDELATIKAKLALLQGSATKTTGDLENIKAEMALLKSLLETTRDYLLTPQGRREGFKP